MRRCTPSLTNSHVTWTAAGPHRDSVVPPVVLAFSSLNIPEFLDAVVEQRACRAGLFAGLLCGAASVLCQIQSSLANRVARPSSGQRPTEGHRVLRSDSPPLWRLNNCCACQRLKGSSFRPFPRETTRHDTRRRPPLPWTP
jgi:hypothetical protein